MLVRLMIGAALCAAPTAAFACGGLFCNTSQPVEQAAERILFAQDGDTLHMHVRITYQGPPSEFGWLLPAPPDVEIGLSSEQLFVDLDQQFAPRFILRTEFDSACGERLAGGGEGEGEGEGEAQPPGGVNVLSREPVGPFDVAILQADRVEDLRDWLDDNGYQIPEQTDPTLQPYVERQAAFVAVRLLPDQDAGDISPLRLSFSSSRPAIPIVPTSVAATPDMGIIVHVLGPSRAIPVNYRHVVINEAAIDWQRSGQNYADVVSQAADEAEGKAFATDFAGLHGGLFWAPYTQQSLAEVAAAETLLDLLIALRLLDGFGTIDADLQRVLVPELHAPPGVDVLDILSCPGCYDEEELVGVEFDAAAIAARVEAEINEPRAHLNALSEANPYLTRLYSTLSAAEMDLDPEFDFNPDLGAVPNQRTAIRRVGCDEGFIDFTTATIETPSGLEYQLVDGENPNAIQRQDGETVRGIEVPAARFVERTFVSGPSEVEVDRTDEITGMGASLDAGGCACDVAPRSTPGPAAWLLGLVGLLGLRRSRRG